MAKKLFTPNFEWDSILERNRTLSHLIRRSQVKKFKRKFKRQLAAFEREKKIKRYKKSREYKRERKELHRKRKEKEKKEKRKTKEESKKWLQAELQFRLNHEQKILKAREQEEIKAKQKETEDRVLDELAWKSATISNDKPSEIWHNPFLPIDTNFVDECPYFKKVGACRFEFKCKLQHNVPYSSHILLFPNMFQHISLVHPLRDGSEFDETDLWIESDEDEIQKLYKLFYLDILEEFQKFGEVVLIFVCRNEAAHLRGNVYVEYSEKTSAVIAEKSFKGRWYDGRQIWPRFCTIDSWKAAICDSFSRRNCLKRNKCNFLHVFNDV